MKCVNRVSGGVACTGRTSDLGDFNILTLDYQADGSSSAQTTVKSMTVAVERIWQAKSILSQELKRRSPDQVSLEDQAGQGNIHFVQKSFKGVFKFDVFFSSDSNTIMTSDALTQAITDGRKEFQERFSSVYAPQEPFTTAEYTRFSQYLLSNLMGGIGYFYGNSRVDTSSPEAYSENDPSFWEKAAAARAHAIIEDDGPHELFSAVPSRPFFPRGFLWDEGFHLQVVMDWDMDVALEIVSSWFGLMTADGWIAREQILGPEARSKVPSEFQIQYPHVANPPTLFLVVAAFSERLQQTALYSGAPSQYLSDIALGTSFLREIYPKLKTNYQWFCRTQAGNLTRYQGPGTSISQGYRWRGRTPQHTLTSGLDDYPRAQPPHPEELHVDALSWVGSMVMTLNKISVFLGEKDDQRTFARQEEEIIQSIERAHWSEPDQAYCDTTIAHGTTPNKVCHKGYISLLPFCLGLMVPNSPHLGAVLDLIHDPEELWSSFGIRSLSTKDKYYGTEEDYWRGPVWININYMILERLLELARQRGPHESKASEMYIQLRLNLVNTVFNSWNATGFAWEQYNAKTGKGQRTQHFTGWTALIVKILAMPPVPQTSSSQGGKISNEAVDARGSSTQLYIVAMIIAFFVYSLRRRLIKLWRKLR
ncbi:MAG: hypothetical protein Q9205_006547 [Flavoplaca limonia]